MTTDKINYDHYHQTQFSNEQIATFLEEHLDEFGDAKEDILKCIDFVQDEKKGGHIILATNSNEIIGAVILNNTGMSGYIPENILVYIAVNNTYRGMGVGKKLMQEAIQISKGNIALHCEPDNPARKLYEKLGFTSKYLEMRLTK
ncbi:GNAT family N-acetyltransferase [Flavobacterium sp. PLA-1-15]|uniref:GNAT family N-acetyltransferase n=1 Tax=Flavobacterium sp. PLA-1-15 TaxID=3380533 RepID=UPI003B80D96B